MAELHTAMAHQRSLRKHKLAIRRGPISMRTVDGLHPRELLHLQRHLSDNRQTLLHHGPHTHRQHPIRLSPMQHIQPGGNHANAQRVRIGDRESQEREKLASLEQSASGLIRRLANAPTNPTAATQPHRDHIQRLRQAFGHLPSTQLAAEPQNCRQTHRDAHQ